VKPPLLLTSGFGNYKEYVNILGLCHMVYADLAENIRSIF
jgi:hypothetical protein